MPALGGCTGGGAGTPPSDGADGWALVDARGDAATGVPHDAGGRISLDAPTPRDALDTVDAETKHDALSPVDALGSERDGVDTADADSTHADADASQAPTDVLYGLSQVNGAAIDIALALGARALRPTLSWRAVEPDVTIESVTLADVQSDAAVEAFVDSHDLSAWDERVCAIAEAGLEPIPIVGHGFSSALPRLDGVPAAPDVLGEDEYLARQYLTARVAVERYDGDGWLDAPCGAVVHRWQTENELNQAMLTAVLGWRYPTDLSAAGSMWANWDYVSSILATLRQAVLDADPQATTMLNFHTDVAPALSEALGQPSWPEAIAQWAPLMDVVGIDAYPNYYQPEPVRGAVLAERIETARQAAGGLLPVAVIETGYPSGPTERGFSEELQAEYAAAAFDAARSAGATWFLWFGSQTADEHGVTIEPGDQALLEQLGELFEGGDLQALLTFVNDHPDLAKGHLRDVLLTVEAYWGLWRPDGTPKPAFDVLRDRIGNTDGTP